MSWASSEWKVGLPSSAQVKISELETQLEKLQKDRQQRQLQVDRLEALVDGQKKKHEEDRLRVLAMEKEIVQLNTNMEENIRQLLKAQQEVLAKDRNLLNYQNQLDAQKRLHDQEIGKVKRLEMELEQQRVAMRSCADPNEITILHKRITELENLRSKQEELIRQLESKEDKIMYGQAGDNNQLQETVMRLEKECEDLKTANSKLEIELWSKNNSDSDCALSNTCRSTNRLQNDTSKIQIQLEDAKNKITDLERQSIQLENNRRTLEIAYAQLEQELQEMKFHRDQEIEDLRCQLEETENNYIQEKQAVEAVKNYLKDSETKSRLLEEEINELRLHVQNSTTSVLMNQELLALRDRCMKQNEQINQLQIEAQTDHESDKIEKLQDLLDRRETEIKHLTKAQKDQDNQLQLMQKKLHAGEELIHSMNLIVNEHKTKCVDDKLELENCKDQLKENVQAVQMLEIEKRQLKKAIQIKESIIQSLMKGDADSSKGMLKNQVVELRLKCEEYESRVSELNDEVKSMQRGKDDRSTYSSSKYSDSGLVEKVRDMESELKLKQVQLDECLQEINNFREMNFSPRSSTSDMPASFSRKMNEREAKLNVTLVNLEKVTSQLQAKEKELKIAKQRCENLEKDYYAVSSQLDSVQKVHKLQEKVADVGQMECLRNEVHKKDKLIRHLQNEMNALQNITLQIEDFQNSIKERDEKIFQLETDLDSEQRLKEERNLAVLTQQNKIKSLQNDLDEKDGTIAEMRNAHDESEMSTQYLRTIQANLQTELQEKENQCSVLQLELNKVQNICQEVESGNRTLQCQVEELKNRLEKVSLDKEESDNNVGCLQMELFNLKNELQTTYKSAEKAREKMEHKTNEIVALSVELEKKERHIISQQIQLDKLLRSHEEQDACIHSLMSRLTSLQSDIEEKEKSSGIFSLQPDFLSSKTGLNPKVLQAELWAMKSQLESKEKQLEKARLHLEERDGSIQFLRTLLVTLQNDLEEKEKALKAAHQQLASVEENMRKQETVNFDLQKQLKGALKENEEKMSKITATLNEVELAHRDQEDKKTRIQNLRSQMHTMQTKLESTLKEKEEKKSTISALRSQIQSLQNKIQMAQKDREDKRACIQALQSELQVLQDEVDVSRKVNDKKEHKIQLLNTQLGAIKLELEEREKIINTLHSEMGALRQNDQEKDSTIDKLTLQLQTAQSKFESSNMAVQSLQNEVQNLKSMSMKEIKESNPTCQNKKNFESYVQMLVSEMESMQYTLQSTQSEWEEKEDAFHAIANHVHKLQAKLEEKRAMTGNLEKELNEMTDQTKECRLRCLMMETQLLQDELESKEAALMDATQQLRQSGEQRRRVEQEVSKLLTEMEEIQQGQEKSQQPITPESVSDDRKDGNDEQLNCRQLKIQLIQANSRIEILMSDSEEMRNAMEILEFEKLELQESQDTLLCENQNLNKKLKSLESELEFVKTHDDAMMSSKTAKQSCTKCNEYLKEIMMLKELKENNNVKIKDQEKELTRTNQELDSLTTSLDVQKAKLLAITEERDKAIFELSLIERENGNQSSPTEALMFQLEMKSQKESVTAKAQEVVSKFLLTVKEHCTLANDQGLNDENVVAVVERGNLENDDENLLNYLRVQHQHVLHEIIEFKKSVHSKVKGLEESQTKFPLAIAGLEEDKVKLSQLLNDKMSQLEDVLKSLESLTERTLLLEREKNEFQTKAEEKIENLEKQKDEIAIFLRDKNQVLEESNMKIDAMTKTISSMAVDHKEFCDALNLKLKQMETEKAELEKNLDENQQKFDLMSKKYRVKSEKKEELAQKFGALCTKVEELETERTKLVARLDDELARGDDLRKKVKDFFQIKSEKETRDQRLVRVKEFFERALCDLEIILSDMILLLKSEGTDWTTISAEATAQSKITLDKDTYQEFQPSAEKLVLLRELMVKVKENLNAVLAAHEDNKSELLCSLMQKNQNLQIESEKNTELENCIVKLNEELMEFKDSLENEKLELVEKHLRELEEMKGQYETQKQIEENNKALLDTMSAKVGMIEEEKMQLLETVSQNIKTLEHRKAQLSAMKQDLKIMKKEKEQIIGIILVREETIKDLEQKLKKVMNDNKLKSETISRQEQGFSNLEEQFKLIQNDKNRLNEFVNNLTQKVAELQDEKETVIGALDIKLASLVNEIKENEQRFENGESQLKAIMAEQSLAFEIERSQSVNRIEELEEKIRELDEKIKEEEYELQRERENHALDNARKSNCEVDLKEKIDALNVTIQQLQLEKADLLLTTTERISELEDVSSAQHRQLDDMKKLLEDSLRVGEANHKRAEKLQLDLETKELSETQNYLTRLTKLEEEKALLQQALSEKVDLLEKERKVIFDQLQDVEKVKNKLLFEIREKEGKINSLEETLNDSLVANQELEKAKKKLMLDLREKENKALSFEGSLNETLSSNQELEKVKKKLILELREKENKILSFESSLSESLSSNQELEKVKKKLMLELREKENKILSFEGSLSESLSSNEQLEMNNSKMMMDIRDKDERIMEFEEQINDLRTSNQDLDRNRIKLHADLKVKEEKISELDEKVRERSLELEKMKSKLKLNGEVIENLEDRVGKLSSSIEFLEKNKNNLLLELREKDADYEELEGCVNELKKQVQVLEELNRKCIATVSEKEEQIAVLKERMKNGESVIDDLKMSKNLLIAELREKDVRCQELLDKCHELEEEQKKNNQEVEKEKSLFVLEIHKQMEDLREKDEQLKQTSALIEEMEKARNEMLAEMCEKEECLKDSWTTNQELEKVKKNLQFEVSEKEKELQSVLILNQELEKTKSKFIKEIRDKQEQMHNFEERLSDTVTINQDLEKIKSKYFVQIRDKDERIQELENAKSILEEDKSTLEAKAEELEIAKEKLELDLQETENQIDSLQKSINEKDEMIVSYEKSNHEHVIANQESYCLIDSLKETISKLEIEKEFARRAFDEEVRRSGEVQRRCETHILSNQKMKNENTEIAAIVEKMQMALTRLKEEKDDIMKKLGDLTEKNAKCLKEIEQLNDAVSAKATRIEVMQNENQRLKDQMQDLEQNVVMLTESKRNLMAEFMLQKEESNKLNEQITDLTLELERRLRNHEAEKGSLDELQAEVDVHTDQLGVTDDSYLVLMLFKEKLENQLATATKELDELRAQISVLQGETGSTSSSKENESSNQQLSDTKDDSSNQNQGRDMNEDKNNEDQ